jgi:hypothetical protein
MLFQEVTIQKPRSLPNEFSMFLGDDQAQMQTKQPCYTAHSRPRGWSDVALGALFEMDFDTNCSADNDSAARGCPMDIQGQAQQSCTFEQEESSQPFECESAETVLCTKMQSSGNERAAITVAEGAEQSTASQSWACLTQRHTATRSVAIIQRKQQNSWRPPTTR